MRVLVTGAYGFIGSAVSARLLGKGHEVVGLGRNIARATRQLPQLRWISLDIAKATRAEDWLPLLEGIDAVVNCAGALQDGGSDDVRAVHVDGTVALFHACERAGVKRVIHISAIGIDRETPTKFSETKLIADNDLIVRKLDWVILRPSVVYGRNAYGGSALLRAAAALPGFVPVFSGTADLQLVHLDDVAETVAFFIKTDAHARMTLELDGPERMPLVQVVKAFRHWLGLDSVREIPVPSGLATLAFRVGDAASWLGWRPPVRTTAQKELTRGAIGEPAEWTRVTGIAPRSLTDALAREPASVQERWFARLFLLKPALIGGLALFWIATGSTALGSAHGYAQAIALMKEGGASEAVARVAVIGGSIADILIGVAMMFRSRARQALLASIALSLAYLVAASLLHPWLWQDPLGPLVKILPVLLASFATLAILDDR